MSRFDTFLPFESKREEPPVIPIESRPGLVPLDDPLDYPHRWEQKLHQTISELQLGEIHHDMYHDQRYFGDDHGDMDYWWFIFGAIGLGLFLVAVEYSERGVQSEWYCNLEFFPGSGDPTIIWLGNVFVALMLAWSAYHMFKYNNSKIVRYGAVFLMVAIYITMLAWALSLFNAHAVRNALFYIIGGLVFLGGWIILSFWNVPDNDVIIIPLVLGFLLFVYLVYYTWGIVEKNPNYKDDPADNRKNNKRDDDIIF